MGFNELEVCEQNCTNCERCVRTFDGKGYCEEFEDKTPVTKHELESSWCTRWITVVPPKIVDVGVKVEPVGVKCKDMDDNLIEVGDKILVSTRDGHIRRATITSLEDYGWVYYTMDVSKKNSCCSCEKVLKIN